MRNAGGFFAAGFAFFVLMAFAYLAAAAGIL